MILSDKKILESIENGEIVITPFNLKCLGSNSYDVHLSKHLAVYVGGGYLDPKKDNPIERFEIPENGFPLFPNQLYLGSTVEYTETHNAVPFLEGKSSIGRLGIDIHATAGKGDVGFSNHWTLEISVKIPVIVYAGMPIGQLIYFAVDGDVLVPYNRKENAKYNHRSSMPVPSAMWRNF